MTRHDECAVISICSAHTATMCREFLRRSQQRDKLGSGTETDAEKRQPLPSAAAIRPLLLKASALLSNVRQYHYEHCVLVGTGSCPRACTGSCLLPDRYVLRKQRSWWHCWQPCMLPWHQRKHLLVVNSARTKPLPRQVAWWLMKLTVCEGKSWAPETASAAIGLIADGWGCCTESIYHDVVICCSALLGVYSSSVAI